MTGRSVILDLDIGNSRIKWRLSVSPFGGAPRHGVVDDLASLSAALISLPPPERIRVACVRRQQRQEEIITWAQQSGLVAELARVARRLGGLEIFYTDLGRLGVDRWLAMLACRQRTGGSFLIVDCGTALTVDLVAADGRHLGGYIVPGLGLSRRALEEHTAIRLAELPESLSCEPGHSTDAAVSQGVFAMLLKLIESATQMPAMQDAQLFLTGGDAPRFQAALVPGVRQLHRVEQLVLDGLAIALP